MSGCGTTGAAQGDDGYCALYKPVFLTEVEFLSVTSTTKRAFPCSNAAYGTPVC